MGENEDNNRAQFATPFAVALSPEFKQLEGIEKSRNHTYWRKYRFIKITFLK